MITQNELIEVLRECVTVDGAACWKSRAYAEKRIKYISRITEEALAKVQANKESK